MNEIGGRILRFPASVMVLGYKIEEDIGVASDEGEEEDEEDVQDLVLVCASAGFQKDVPSLVVKVCSLGLASKVGVT